MPVPGHGEGGIAVGTHEIEERREHEHAEEDTADDAPGGDLREQQDCTADHHHQRRRLPDGSGNRTDEGIQPGVLGLQAVHAFGSDHAEGCRAAVTVDRGPHGITGELRGVGEVEEGSSGQCRVEEILARTAENLLADHHAKADSKRRLPERQIRRADQGKEDRGDEETLVDLVSALDREEHLPEAAHDEGDRVNRYEVQRAEEKVVPDVARVVVAEKTDQRSAPTVDAPAGHGVDLVGLEAQVVHAVEHRGERREPHGDHDALEVDTVAHVGRRLRDRRRLVENRVYGFEERIKALEASSLLGLVLDVVEPFA